MNRLDMVKDSGESVIADYTYDTLSRRTQADLLNGTRAEYGYDDIDRLTSLVNKKVSPEAVFSEYLFGLYDDVGNLKQMSRDGEGYTFDYDAIYQLKTTDYPEDHHSPDKTYNYDSLGNRTSIIGGGLESYTTNNLNQYTKVSGVSYGYDNSGNLTSDGTNTYAYDSENRLTSTGSYTYTYDPFGRRTRKQGPGTDITYVYDGDQVIEERDGSEAVIATYVYGPGIDECISMTRGGETYYYHYDRLGSVVNLSDSSGDLVETYQYDAWGNADTYGAVDNPYFFTGRRYDPETGNYYYRARYYSPAIGRFLQTDPFGYFDGPNLYTYVTNNPVNFVDPHGLRGMYYGNWGGPDWTGGQSKPYEDLTSAEQAALKGPIDEMDALYKEHDIAYSKARCAKKTALNRLPPNAIGARDRVWDQYRSALHKADIKLAKGLRTLNPDPRKWKPAAPDPQEARNYHKKAKFVFNPSWGKIY